MRRHTPIAPAAAVRDDDKITDYRAIVQELPRPNCTFTSKAPWNPA